jgi:hypothetical protein
MGGAVFLLLHATAADAAFSSGSTGADGAYAPTSSASLALPASGVFNFTTVTIPAGVTVTIARNAANTPLTLLATGDVTIAGTLDLSGKPGAAGANATITGPTGGAGGPGGDAGGNGSAGMLGTTGGRGLGPGGGAPGAQQAPSWPADCSGGGGGHGAAGAGGTPGYHNACTSAGGAAFGNARLLPLLGGSGGGGGSASFGFTAGGGGGGGGALLLASSTRITLTGSIKANGGNGAGVASGNYSSVGAGGGGSGGAVRLMAPVLAGSGGSIQVAGGTGAPGECVPDWIFFRCPGAGGNGASGRIRLEADSFSLTAAMTVLPSQGPLGLVALATAPTLRFTSVAGVTPPPVPEGSYAVPDLTLPLGFANPAEITLQGSHVPPGTAVTVTSVPMRGAGTTAAGTLTGTLSATSASVALSLPTNQSTILMASAVVPLLAANDRGSMYADGAVPSQMEGEEITHVKLAAVFGGRSSVTYITRSGREVSLP